MARRSDEGPRKGPPRGPRDGAPKVPRKGPRFAKPSQAPRAVHPYRDPARQASDGHPRAHPDDRLIRVAGLPSVTELFETGADRVERLYFEAGLKAETQDFCAILTRRRKVYRQVGDDEMRRVAGTAMHGGVVALARPRPIRELNLDAAQSWAAKGEPLLIFDGIGNPQNIGAIARTAAFFGIRRIVLSDHPGQAGLSDASYRVAKGGLERIDFYRATGLPDVLRRLASNYHVVGTAAEKGTYLRKLEKTGAPLALVLGNEEEGLPAATLAACTSVVLLDGSGHVQSLNVSAAAAILIYNLLAAR
jgi:TrmH RNA methyltransferase